MNQTQSLAIVKQLLKTSLSSITYLRRVFGTLGLFPEENYEDFQVGSESGSYYCFFLQDSLTNSNLIGLALKHLKRDYSREANSLLDWLETGIFDALAHQYLRAIIFGIFLDPNEPNKLVECYTFKLTYPHGEPLLRIENHEGQVLATVGGDNSGNASLNQQHAFTIGEIKKSLQQLLRRLILLTQTLKPLPDNRYIVVKLHYYEDVTPANYEPLFFRASCSDQERLIFGQKPEKIPVGEVETAYHGLNLTIQTIADSTTLEELDQEPNTEFRISNIIDSSSMIIESPSGNAKKQPSIEKWSAELDLDEDETFMFNTTATSASTPIPVHQLPRLGDIQNTNNQEIIRVDEDEEDNTTVVFMEETLHQITEIGVGSDSNEDKDNKCNTNKNNHNTRDSSSITYREASQTPPHVPSTAENSLLCAEAKTSDISNDDEQNSITIAINSPRKAITQTYKNPRKSSQVQEQQKQQVSEKLQSCDEVEDQKEEKVPGKCQCDCGSRTSDGEMIRCSKCDTWGHVVCYGYTSKRDPRLLENHVCYRCLHSEFERNKKNNVSAKNDDELWSIEKLEDLALLRRMVIILWNEEPPKNYQVLRERLGIKYSKATQRVQKRLKNEGFIKQNSKQTNNNGRAKNSNEPLFIVIKSPENKSKMENYFDPLLGIPMLQENKVTLPAVEESNHRLSASEPFRNVTSNINNRINATPPPPAALQVIEEANSKETSPMEISPLPSFSQKYGESNAIEINSPPLEYMEISSKHGLEQDVIGVPPQDHTRGRSSSSSHDTTTTAISVLNNNDGSSSGIATRDQKKRKVSISIGHIAVL
ncbi:6466_t:CDS:10 [Ambispora gerdemannii]|uniref:6466_t:CDS:1 n=1 Tax=Ambispora gerdemannii TaxID=144530 RepID=A0A9N9BX66_9GLOM|nr:6466_t:CDS:10 [Ambispora gerdemannii]